MTRARHRNNLWWDVDFFVSTPFCMLASRTFRMRIQKFQKSKLRILLFPKHQTFLESVKYWWNEKQMKLVTFFKNFHGFHEKQDWVSNVVLSWRVSWKTNFFMRKPSTLSGSHFTTICSILKSFGVLKRSGFEFFIFVIFTCVCKTCDMQSCNSSVKQNEQHFTTIPHQIRSRNDGKTQNEQTHLRQMKLYPINLLLSKFEGKRSFRKKCRFMHIWST